MSLKALRKAIALSCPFFIRRLVPKNISRHIYFEGVFSARLFNKKIIKLVSHGHQIENEIYWNGFEDCHEGTSTQIWVEIIRTMQPKVIWDIGANSGTYGLLAKAISPKSEVCFFEPMHNAAQMIQENLKENALEGRVFELALGNFDGDGTVYLPEGTSFVTSVTVNRDTTKNPSTSKETKIGVRRADSLINEKKLLLPDLVKLDVETYEPEVLSGFGVNFPRECSFIIEILSAEIATRVSHYFPKLEYNFYNIDDQKKSIRKTEFLEKSDFYNYLILPKSRRMVNFSGNE